MNKNIILSFAALFLILTIIGGASAFIPTNFGLDRNSGNILLDAGTIDLTGDSYISNWDVNQGFQISLLKEKEGKMEIKGIAMDNPTIAQFMTNLEKSGVIKNIELVVSQQVEKKDLKLKEFTLTCQVHYGSSPSGPTS